MADLPIAGGFEIIALGGFAVVAIIVYFYFKLQSGYNYKVEIFEKKHGALLSYEDKAKRIKESGAYKLELQKRKTKIEIPDHLLFILDSKTAQQKIKLYSPSPGNFEVVTFEEGTMKVQSSSRELLRSVEIEKDNIKYNDKSWIEKYGWLVAIAIIIFGFAMVLYVTFPGLVEASKAIAGGTEKLSNTCDKLIQKFEQACPQLGSASTPTPVTEKPPF